MRNVLVAAVLLAVMPAATAAQSSSAGSLTRTRGCRECEQDSSLRVMHKQRMERRDQVQRIAKVAHELTLVRQALAKDADELSLGERRRLRAREARLESQLTEIGARVGLETSARALREIGPAIAGARRAMVAAMAEAGVAAAGFSPEGVRFPGWIGITLDAPCTVVARNGDVYWRFLEHPQIVSIDPGSPAERAGIRQGDVLLAYDGQDVRREIAMNRLLRPGRTVRVRVRGRGDNDVRELPVRVAPARDVVVGERVPLPRARLQGPGLPRSPRARVEARAFPEPGELMIAPDPRVASSPVIAFRRFSGVAGAHMETITRGLGEAIGVERGVLVLSVSPGVPAHESGLIDGDVILKADGRDVASVQELRRVLASSDEKAVKLDVARRGKVRQVTLRW